LNRVGDATIEAGDVVCESHAARIATSCLKK
jgi:hypothetical protein